MKAFMKDALMCLYTLTSTCADFVAGDIYRNEELFLVVLKILLCIQTNGNFITHPKTLATRSIFTVSSRAYCIKYTYLINFHTFLVCGMVITFAFKVFN